MDLDLAMRWIPPAEQVCESAEAYIALRNHCSNKLKTHIADKKRFKMGWDLAMCWIPPAKQRSCRDNRVCEMWSTSKQALKLILLHGIIVVINLKLIYQTEHDFKSTGKNLLFYCIQFRISDYGKYIDYRPKK